MSEIKQRLEKLRENIVAAAKRAGRDHHAIKLVAVTKYATIEQIKEAYQLGLRHFAESKVQDALEKMDRLPEDISWHFIGRIQSNKIGKMIGKFLLIHSIADLDTAKEVSEKSVEKGLVQSVLLQLNASGESTKQGFSKEEIKGALKELNSLEGIQIEGLMTMGPHTNDKKAIRACFKEVRELSGELASLGDLMPHLSMGMSGDYELAIEEGATLLRIGSLLFGDNKNEEEER